VLIKTIDPIMPPKTAYERLPKGQQLQAVIQAMAAFGATLNN